VIEVNVAITATSTKQICGMHFSTFVLFVPFVDHYLRWVAAKPR
jgi:hypothetical protein